MRISTARSSGERRARRNHLQPAGQEPGDVWVIPNVKHNQVEKTAHPCQFPIELVERLILALTNEDDLVVDPYLGVRRERI
jgi:DNA modification methylase